MEFIVQNYVCRWSNCIFEIPSLALYSWPSINGAVPLSTNETSPSLFLRKFRSVFLFLFSTQNIFPNWKSQVMQLVRKFDGTPVHWIWLYWNHILTELCKQNPWKTEKNRETSGKKEKSEEKLANKNETMQIFMLNSFIKLWEWINESYLFNTWRLNALRIRKEKNEYIYWNISHESNHRDMGMISLKIWYFCMSEKCHRRWKKKDRFCCLEIFFCAFLLYMALM